MRRVLTAVLAAAALAGMAGCGEDADPRALVNAYVDQANAIQQRLTSDFQRANDAYGAYARGNVPSDGEIERVERAEVAIRAARDELGALRPPAPARAVHGRLLHYLDLNVRLARETSRLAEYRRAAPRAQPALERANRRLATRLREAGAPGPQARALARFADDVAGVVHDLRALEPPLVLRPAHERHVRSLESTRALAVRLRRALERQDAEEVARLLERFRARAASRPAGLGVTRGSVARYNRAYRRLVAAGADVRREQARLNRSLADR